MYNYRKVKAGITTLPLGHTQSRALWSPFAGEDLVHHELWSITNRWKWSATFKSLVVSLKLTYPYNIIQASSFFFTKKLKCAIRQHSTHGYLQQLDSKFAHLKATIDVLHWVYPDNGMPFSVKKNWAILHSKQEFSMVRRQSEWWEKSLPNM